jgi:hypothetical protein
LLTSLDPGKYFLPSTCDSKEKILPFAKLYTRESPSNCFLFLFGREQEGKEKRKVISIGWGVGK